MRYALCLSGLVGNIEGKFGDSVAGADEVLLLAAKHWHKYIIEPNSTNGNSVDIFIHSWNLELARKIRKIFKPKLAHYEAQRVFDIPKHVQGDEKRKQNHYSRWYSNEFVMKLKRRYEHEQEFQYDAVMLARFDIAWKKTIDFSELKPYEDVIYCGDWKRRSHTKVKDFWFIGTSKVMDKFGYLFSNLNDYTKPDRCSPNVKLGISHHRLAKYHIDSLKLKASYLLECNDDYDPNQQDYPLVRYEYFKARV